MVSCPVLRVGEANPRLIKLDQHKDHFIPTLHWLQRLLTGSEGGSISTADLLVLTG